MTGVHGGARPLSYRPASGHLPSPPSRADTGRRPESGSALARRDVNTHQSLLARTNLILDIYRALGVLARHPRVDPARIAVIGFSRGGQAALYASLRRFDAAWNRSGVTPALYLPVYPDCSIRFRDDTALVDRQIRMFGGSGDDYNPAATCAAYGGAAEGGRCRCRPDRLSRGAVRLRQPGRAQPARGRQGRADRPRLRDPRGGGRRPRRGPNATPLTYADPCVQRDPHIGLRRRRGPLPCRGSRARLRRPSGHEEGLQAPRSLKS